MVSPSLITLATSFGISSVYRYNYQILTGENGCYWAVIIQSIISSSSLWVSGHSSVLTHSEASERVKLGNGSIIEATANPLQLASFNNMPGSPLFQHCIPITSQK